MILAATASQKPKRAPSWIHDEEADPSVKHLFSTSEIGKECDPRDFHRQNTTETVQ